MLVEQQICKNPRLKKDKGVAWIILVMSFFSHTVNIGFTYAVIGNLTIAHQQLFGVTLNQSSLIGSSHIAVLGILAPLASILVKSIGYRLTQVLGGISMVLAVGLSALSTQYWHALLLFGFLGGFGVSTTYTASSAILGLHFDRRKYFAFSAASMGFYAGMIFWPIASQKLLDTFGYSKAMSIMAGPQFIHIVAGMIYFQPYNNLDHPEGSVDTNSARASQEENPSESKLGFDNPAVECDSDDGEIEVKVPQKEEEVGPGEDKSKLSASINLRQEFVALFKSYKIWLLMANFCLWGSNASSFLIVVNDYIVRKTGATEEEIALGITIIGVSNIVGCLIMVATSSLKYDRLISHTLFIAGYGVSTIISAFSTGKVMFYVVCSFWGISYGCFISNLLAAVNEFCTPERFALTFGFALLAEGVGSVAGTSFVSYISEDINELAAIIVSGCMGLAGSCCLIPMIVQRLRAR